MPLSNKTNKTNKTGEGDDELAPLGGGDSLALSAALDTARLALAQGKPAEVALMPARVATEPRLFGWLNPRHRHELLVAALLKGVTVPSKPVAEVTLKVNGADRITLGVRRPQAKGDPVDLFWKDQVDQLRNQAWNRDERLGEIVAQQSDLLSFLGLAVPVGQGTHPKTLMLLDAVQDATFRAMVPLKHAISLARPHVLAPDVAPVIQTPAHSAFPAGHAGEAFAAARVLGVIYPSAARALRHAAARIADNRGYAGVHYPVDSLGGAILGDSLGALWANALWGVPDFGETRDGTAMPAPITSFIAGAKAPDQGSVAFEDVEDYAAKGHAPGTQPDITKVPTATPILEWVAREALREAEGQG